MSKVFGGIDNGITGSIGIITPDRDLFCVTPTKSEQNYTKAKGNITRIDAPELVDLLLKYIEDPTQTMFLLERPLTGGFGSRALNSAMRSLEATLIVLEILNIPYRYIDSKEWQRELLPQGTRETAALKKASEDIGSRLFPHYKDLFGKHKDADGMLIAEYCRIKYRS